MKNRESPGHIKSSDTVDTPMAISHLKLSSAKNKQWSSETNLATHALSVNALSKQSQLSHHKPVQAIDMKCISMNRLHDKLVNRSGQSSLGHSQLSQSQPTLSFPLPDYSKVKSIVKANIIAQQQRDHEHQTRKAAISAQSSVVCLDSVDHSFAAESHFEPTYQDLVDELKDRHDQDRKFHELQNRYIQLANRYAEAETFIDKIRFLTPDEVGNYREVRRFISLEELHPTQPSRSSVNLPFHQTLSNQQLSHSLDLINTNEPAEKLHGINQEKSFKLPDTTSFFQGDKMSYLCEQLGEDLPTLEDDRSSMLGSESATVVVDEQTLIVSECEQVKKSPKDYDQHLQMVATEKFMPAFHDHTDVTEFKKTDFLDYSQLGLQSPCSFTSTMNSDKVIMSLKITSSIKEDQDNLEVASQEEEFPHIECYGECEGNEHLHSVVDARRVNEVCDGNGESHVLIDVPKNPHSEFVDETDLKIHYPECNGAKRMLRFGCKSMCKPGSKDNASQSCYKCKKSIDSFVCDIDMHNISRHSHALQPYNLKHDVELPDSCDSPNHHNIKITGGDACSLEAPGYESIEHSSLDQCAEAVEHSTDSPVLSDDSTGTLSPCRKVELWQASSAPQSEHLCDKELRRLTGMVYSLHEEISSVRQLVSRLQRSPSSSSSLISSPQSEQRRQRYLRKMFTIQQPLLPDKFPLKPAAGRWDISRPPYGDLRSPYADEITPELTVKVKAVPVSTVKTLDQGVQAGGFEKFESTRELSKGSNDSIQKMLIKQNSVDTADRIHHLAHKVRLKSGNVLRRLTESTLR